MAKVVINRCYGGFGLSHEAMMLYCEKKGITVYPEKDSFYHVYWLLPKEERKQDNVSRQTIYECDIDRDDPALVAVVEELGKKANGSCADLRVIDIEKGTLYRIDEYDGLESIEYQYNTVWRVA